MAWNLLSIAAIVVAVIVLGFFWLRRMTITQGIVLANFFVFILMIAAGFMAGTGFGTIVGTPFLADLALRPVDLISLQPTSFLQVFTSAFLHFNFLHVLGNMVILLMIGIPFEDRVGRGGFLLIYFSTAVTAILLHVVYTQLVEGPAGLSVPLLGASGAVFGILAAFATTYPNDRVPMWLLFIVLPRVPVAVAAIVLMLLEAVLLIGGPADSVARAAHLGGAVGGVIIGPIVKAVVAKREASDDPKHLDLEALERLATQPPQQAVLLRLKENIDEPDARAAWLERLAGLLECPTCGQNYRAAGANRMRCANGHEVRFDAP